FNLNSEEYICSGSKSKFEQEGVEITSYKREGNVFIQTVYGEEHLFKIIHETPGFVILAQTYEYPSIFTTIIDKVRKVYTEYYLISNEQTRSLPMVGQCMIR
ncbi:MAG: hypothetical protein CMN00_08840, partial [Rickettsiales bacterium]|nr:hypothetical protein [Rickettsiales bacterium]